LDEALKLLTVNVAPLPVKASLPNWYAEERGSG
jgi:hypothetical protein